MEGRIPMGLFKALFKGERAGNKLPAVAVGDRLVYRSPDSSVWVVERISSVGASTYPLVSLAREGHPDLKKTVSIAVIEEGGEFRPAV